MVLVGTTVFERQRPPASVVRQSLAGTRQSVFWLDDLPASPARPALTGHVTADLAIVGGGYTGLWTALLAKRRNPDARVVVIEARTVGWAASGRNGGFCEASLTHGRDNGLSRWPGEIDRLDRMGMANLDAMGDDIAAHRIDADWERVGSLTVATEPHQLEWLDEWATDAAARGDEGVQRLSRAEVQAAVASPTFIGASGRRTPRRSSIPESSQPGSRTRRRRPASRSSSPRRCGGSTTIPAASCSAPMAAG